MIRPKSPPVQVLMKPRTMKLNAHRTLEYYTPEDLQRLVDQLGDRVVAVPVVNQADLGPPAQREQTAREWVEERFRKGREAYLAEQAQPAPVVVPGLHPRTADLVQRFAVALALKLAAAEAKYGYSDDWASPDWMDECRVKLVEHVAKGDPRDVAAYCAFLWQHGERTALPAPVAVPEGVAVLRELRAEIAAMKENPRKGDMVFRCGFNGAVDVVVGRIDAMLAAAKGVGS